MHMVSALDSGWTSRLQSHEHAPGSKQGHYAVLMVTATLVPQEYEKVQVNRLNNLTKAVIDNNFPFA